MWSRLRRLMRSGAGFARTAATGPAYGAWQPDPMWVARRRSRGATYVDLDGEAIRRACAAAPALRDAVLAAAERALRHEFSLLGSGLFVPVDPDRPARGPYRPIDWYLDPVRGLRFPRGVPHAEWKLYEMRPGNADIKYPWELARCQHWVTLGQAFRITGDERFAREIGDELADFVEANPVGIGIHWTCTMDVALRAVSWVLALDLVRGSAALGDAWWTRAASALFDHGLFVRANLENTYEVTSNHFLSNVVGLWFLSAWFADTADGRAWAAFAADHLEREIDVQVLPDGADFESSVPYHRLVAELFLGAARLDECGARRLSARYRARVRDMAAYLAAVLRPDGLMPQVGDADDGRLHVLAGAGAWTPQDARHLLGPAALMFGVPEWLQAGGPAAAWEAAWWGLRVPDPAPAAAAELPPVVRLFPDAGHAVARSGGLYLLVTNSRVGTRGFGNHKHNDQLGFEYHVGGQAVFVDPGSYVYTSDFDARNRFRSTGLHNTVSIDGIEQHDVNPEWLFRLFERGEAEHLAFRAAGGQVEYAGRHRGYERLPDPVSHERRFRLDLSTGELRIVDRLHGRGRHRLVWHFHLAPGVAAEIGEGVCRLTAPGLAAELAWPRGLEPRLASSWYSPSYGVRLPCVALDLAAEVALDGSAEWEFRCAPAPEARP